MLAFTADGWTQLIVALSIFVPVVLATGLTIWVLRGMKSDPDEQRRRRIQAEHEAQSRDP